VELIVVITILAILWTIAFISLQWYSRDARDSTRTADIWNMKTSLELFNVNAWKYPAPDSPSTISYSWDTVWYQWTFWNQVTTNLKQLTEKPLDPLTQSEYTYSTTNSYKEYQILALYEWNVAYNQSPHSISPKGREVVSIIPTANAAITNLIPKVVWNYNWVFVKIPWYIIPTPSIITAEPGNITLDWINIHSQVTTNGTNIPQTSVSNIQTWSLNINLKVFTWSITDSSKYSDKLALMKKVQEAYSWTILSNNSLYSSILNKTTNKELVSLTETMLKLKKLPIKDWTQLDPNCDIPNITIWTQTWAWCNSTLWSWIEYWQLDSDIWTNNYNWTVWNCYNYNWSPIWTCTKWDITMASNTKANTWYTWTNANWDSAVNNIWWKLYIWANSSSACPTWYHVPSDVEWSTVENTLFWNICDTWLNIPNCTWVGWKNYSTSVTSIVSKLWISLAGNRNIDGVTFSNRGNSTKLWSSTPNASNAYNRTFNWINSWVFRYNFHNKLVGFSVRCIKD